jgi:hypothetical protein
MILIELQIIAPNRVSSDPKPETTKFQSDKSNLDVVLWEETIQRTADLPGTVSRLPCWILPLPYCPTIISESARSLSGSKPLAELFRSRAFNMRARNMWRRWTSTVAVSHVRRSGEGDSNAVPFPRPPPSLGDAKTLKIKSETVPRVFVTV